MNGVRRLRLCCTIVLLMFEHAACVAAQSQVIQHVPVYDVDGRFGGWPANHGIWSWGDEILVGFSAGYFKNLGPERHAIDRERPEEHLLARSSDGGMTWQIENPARQGVLLGNRGMRHGTVPPGYQEAEPIDCPGGIQFTHPDFAMTLRMSSVHTGPSRFYFSYDRGKTWKGPFRLPLFGKQGIAARTDYLVNGDYDCHLFLTASKSNNREGRAICVRTLDGGKTWKHLADIGPEPAGFAIMPSTVRLSVNELLCLRRRREGKQEPRRRWIDAYASRDNGLSWSYLNDPAPDVGEGNPPCLIKLRDGRLCLTYGYRAEPFGIHARLSHDNGHTWSAPFVLRDDGASRDIGYPRTVQRPDGKLVTVYYIHDPMDVDRKIVATIWDPGNENNS